jgi:hypothetical protein
VFVKWVRDAAEGCVVCVDAARFLPDSTTISKVTATVYTAQRRRLASVVASSLPASSSRSPKFHLVTPMDTKVRLG